MFCFQLFDMYFVLCLLVLKGGGGEGCICAVLQGLSRLCSTPDTVVIFNIVVSYTELRLVLVA